MYLLFLKTMNDRSSGVKNVAVAGKSTRMKNARMPTETVAMPSRIFRHRQKQDIVELYLPRLTKIHDQPSKPCVPLMKLIP